MSYTLIRLNVGADTKRGTPVPSIPWQNFGNAILLLLPTGLLLGKKEVLINVVGDRSLCRRSRFALYMVRSQSSR
jgi:hypothetical protein